MHGAARAGGDGFDGLVAGIAQMHMWVDQPGQHVQAGGVQGLLGRGVRTDTQGDDVTIAHADIGFLHTPGQHAGAVADQKVVMGGHERSFMSMDCFISPSGTLGHAVTIPDCGGTLCLAPCRTLLQR
jgi:hypothetical protein